MRLVRLLVPFLLTGFVLVYSVHIIFFSEYSAGSVTYLQRNRESIVASLIASAGFTIFIAGASSIFYQISNKWAREFWLKVIYFLSGKDFYKVHSDDDVLDEVSSSLENTKLVFIRIGNFNLNTPRYNKVVEAIIKNENFWDYHIHLKSVSSSNKFLEDFYVFNGISANGIRQVSEIKPINTVQLSQIKRADFDDNIRHILNPYNISLSFSDIIIQGTVVASDYPELGQFDLSKLTVTEVTFFDGSSGEAIKLDASIQKSVSTALIEVIVRMIGKTASSSTLFISKDCLDRKDPEALKKCKEFMSP